MGQVPNRCKADYLEDGVIFASILAITLGSTLFVVSRSLINPCTSWIAVNAASDRPAITNLLA